MCRLVEELGGKHAIMSLMSHPDAEVRYQALTALQKYMVNIF